MDFMAPTGLARARLEVWPLTPCGLTHLRAVFLGWQMENVARM